MPGIPNASSASLTSSILFGRTMLLMSFIAKPPRSTRRTLRWSDGGRAAKCRLYHGMSGHSVWFTRPWREREVGIAHRAHLRHVETFELHLGRHAVAHHHVHQFEEGVERDED